MTKKLKIKIVIEWRRGKPAIFRNVYAFVKPLGSGLYRILSNDHNGNLYFSHDRFNPVCRAFELKD